MYNEHQNIYDSERKTYICFVALAFVVKLLKNENSVHFYACFFAIELPLIHYSVEQHSSAASQINISFTFH